MLQVLSTGMLKNTEIKQSILLADKKSQYDELAKRILGSKMVIAHLLSNMLEEFRGIPVDEIISLIEGEPYVGIVPVEPGFTNAMSVSGERLIGFNTENTEINEGMCRFDIVFYIRRKTGLQKMILNIEAQMSEPKEYPLINRGIFYCCRLVSSQKERNFSNMNYDDLLPVTSIWIVMNSKENCLSHVQLKEDILFGTKSWDGLYDAINLYMIGLGRNVPEKEERKTLHRFLGTLFSETMSKEDKLKILETEFGITMNEKMRGEVSQMCNLSEYFIQRGIEQGIERGIEQGIERGIEQGIAIEKKRTKDLLAEKDALINQMKDQLSELKNMQL